jgi:hypothetical protein
MPLPASRVPRGSGLSVDDRQQKGSGLPVPPARPWGAPASPEPARRPDEQAIAPAHHGRNFMSVAIFVLLFLGVGIQAYRDLSQPGAWDYWSDRYFSPSMTSSLIDNVDLGGRRRPALALRGKIGAASASWLRERLDEAHLKAGDLVVIASLGGDLGQSIIMGEAIRARGLLTAVGSVDASGQVKAASCASACVFVFAGGKTRFGVEGSRLGVHRFTTRTAGDDPVADTQRVTGMVLTFLTRMGISASVVEAMSRTSDIRWLDTREAVTMNLITDPLRRS